METALYSNQRAPNPKSLRLPAPLNFNPEDGGTMFLRMIGVKLQVDIVLKTGYIV
jgi:hypothetical protein